MTETFKKLGIHISEILLPKDGTDLTKWAVIACDQYTSRPEYWEKVRQKVGQCPSTLNMILPEAYLKEDDCESRIAKINETMERYIGQGILESQKPGFVLVERSTPNTPSQKGLMLAVDLECYDFACDAKTLIRATEGTVLDRIPPRVKIRENAPIELPHIMVLIDDPDKTVIESLFEKTQSFEKLYDFELMMGGGHIRGWKIDDAESLRAVAASLQRLADPAAFGDKYGLAGADDSLLLFAVGDGNHSLASAKTHWENVKAALIQKGGASEDIPDHPARYALVEVVNIHDDGLIFEPIHRVLFGVDGSAITGQLKEICKGRFDIDLRIFESKSEMEQARAAAEQEKAAAEQSAPAAAGIEPSEHGNTTHILPFIIEGTYGLLEVQNPVSTLEAGTLQFILDELIKRDTRIDVDYIHGEKTVTELGSQKGHMGFYLPAMSKHSLFGTILSGGTLPRKTFSMGEAEEKRYYLECRRIKGLPPLSTV